MRYSAIALLGAALVAGLFFFQDLWAENEVLVQRRERLQQMSDAEKTRLLEKKKRFDDLPAAEKEQYRTVHQQLVNDPDYDELRATLQRYSDWYKTITPTERAELAKLSPEDRLERVRELMDEQATERFRLMVSQVFKSKNLLDRQDLNVICEWTDAFLRSHVDEILATIPDQERFHRMKAEFDPDKQMHWLRFLYFRRHPVRFRGPPPGGPSGFSRAREKPGSDEERLRKVDPAPPEESGDLVESLPKPSPEDVAALKSRVSRQAQDVLAKAAEEGEQARIIQNWMRAAFLSRIMPPVNRKDLDRFVRESLSKDEREWLESMPRDRMYHELRKLYFRKRFRGERHERGFGGKPRKDGDFGPRDGPRERPHRDRRGERPDFREGHGPPGRRGGPDRPGPDRKSDVSRQPANHDRAESVPGPGLITTWSG